MVYQKQHSKVGEPKNGTLHFRLNEASVIGELQTSAFCANASCINEQSVGLTKHH